MKRMRVGSLLLPLYTPVLLLTLSLPFYGLPCVGNVTSRWDTPEETDGDECTSTMLCGVIDKHPNDKAVRRNLSQQVTKGPDALCKFLFIL